MDFGLKMFLTKDTGEEVPSPLWFKETLPAVRKANRNLSRKQMGSNNRARARFELDLLQERIANQRTDWFFKLAHRITKEYTVICIEDLNIDAMKRLWGRKVSDLAFSEFARTHEWRPSKNNARLIKVSRWYPLRPATAVEAITATSSLANPPGYAQTVVSSMIAT